MKPNPFYGWIIVICSFFIMALFWGLFYTFGVFFRPVTGEFGWSDTAISGAYSLSFVLQGLGGVVTGRMTDRFGPRLVVTICGFFFGAAFLLMSQISTLWQLYFFYSLIGIGMSGTFMPLTSTVIRWFVKRRGMMTGILVSGIGFGTTVMTLLASFLITQYGWSKSYLIVGVIALVVITGLAQFLRRDPQQKGQIAYGESGVEIKRAEACSLSLKQAMKVRQFWFLVILLVCQVFTAQLIMPHLVPHIIETGVLAIAAANAMAILGIFSIIGRITMGSISDRIGPKRSILITFSLLLIALLWLATLARQEWQFYLFAALFGFGYGGGAPLFSLLTAEIFGLEFIGAIMGASTLGGTVGGAVGPIMGGYIFDLTGTYYPAFWLLIALLTLIGFPFIVLLRKLTQQKRQPPDGLRVLSHVD